MYRLGRGKRFASYKIYSILSFVTLSKRSTYMLKNELEKRFFPYVIKPGRYAGGEPGTITKNTDGKTLYCHAFPDKYEIGQSYLGLQTMYHIVNSDERFVCERTFAVDTDAEEVLRKENLPLFSLETFKDLKEFDAIGFTLSYEMVYTNLLNMLDMSSIPLRSEKRDNSFPIIMAGGPAVYNPEPLAPFVDLFFIGDAESGIIEMLEIIHELKGKPKKEILLAIARQVESVYVPAFYDASHTPLEENIPAIIEARVEHELKKEYYPTQPIIPLVETVHQHLAIEIMRGCPQGCRYCQAGPMYRPVRMRPINEIVELVETQVTNSGVDEVTLLSLSSSDYKEIDTLATTIARKLEKDRVSISLPSLRPGTISAKLLDAIKRVRRSGLTISPEAGSERLRKFIRKDFTDEAVYDTASLAFEKGWTTLKLYFMVGLPTETTEDLDAILSMVRNINQLASKTTGRKTINVTLSPFVPKPHTPFQWDELVSPKDVLERILYIKKQNRISNVTFKYPEVETSLMQGVIGRGGRVMADVIETVFKNGGRFDGWNESFSFELWQEALDIHNISIEEMLKPIPFSKDLPWSHIHKGSSLEHLKKERQRTSTQLKEYTIKERNEIPSEKLSQVMEFGRSNKKLVSKQVIAPTKNKVRFRFGKDSRYKYMGHLDNLRLIEKIIRKAKLPVMYSQGFNPSMKLSFGPPLTLGFTSEAEIMDITFDTNFMSYMADKFRDAMPDGFTLYDAKIVLSSKKSISSLLNRAVYTIDVDKIPDASFLEEKIVSILDAKTVEAQRQKKSEVITIDLRPAIYDIELKNEKLFLTLGLGEGGYAKPGEVLQALLGESFDLYLSNFIHRLDLYREEENGNIISAMDL